MPSSSTRARLTVDQIVAVVMEHLEAVDER
jgi:hypothetical protein